MLVKIGDRWLDADLVTGLERNPCHVGYALIACSYSRSYLCGNYDTKELAAKAMDAAAKRINAAQGFKPAAEEKAVMEYTASGPESKRGTFRRIGSNHSVEIRLHLSRRQSCSINQQT